MAPHSLVVPIGSVENAAFSVAANPRPRLAARAFGPLHQDGAIRTGFRVNVSLVPDLERLQPRQHRVRGIDECRGELAGPVPLELRTQQGDVRWRILETKRSRVECQQPLATGHEIEQRLLLGRGDRPVVRVDQQRVVLREVRRVQIGGVGRVGKVEAVGRERRLQHRRKAIRIVVPAASLRVGSLGRVSVTQEQDLDPFPQVAALVRSARAGAVTSAPAIRATVAREPVSRPHALEPVVSHSSAQRLKIRAQRARGGRSRLSRRGRRFLSAFYSPRGFAPRESRGRISRRQRLGGLLNYYCRAV